MGSQPGWHSGSFTAPKSLAAEGDEGTAAGATPSAAGVAHERQDESGDRVRDLVGIGGVSGLPIVGAINGEKTLEDDILADPAGEHLPVSAGVRSGDGAAVGGEDFGVAREVVEPVPPIIEIGPVQPVPRPQLKLMNPFPRKAKNAGSTRRKKTNVQPVPHMRNNRNLNDLHPPTVPGCKWKPSGLSGWELYSRQPAISRNGKRSSKHKYLAYYSREGVQKFYEDREKAAHARRA